MSKAKLKLGPCITGELHKYGELGGATYQRVITPSGTVWQCQCADLSHSEELENEAYGLLFACSYDLLEALRPFAACACDEPHVDEPECNNCRARTVIENATRVWPKGDEK